MENEKIFIHADVLLDGKIRTVDIKMLMRWGRKTQLPVSDWDYAYCDALLSADMKRQKEINRLLDEIQRLRNIVFTLED